MPNETPEDRIEPVPDPAENTISSTETGESHTQSPDSIPETEDQTEPLLTGAEINPDLLRMAVKPGPLFADGDEDEGVRQALEKNAQLVEEVADDMVDVMDHLKRIEAQQANLVARLDALDGKVRDGGRATAREMALLRDTVAGEHKGALTRGAFNAVVTCLDFVRSMRTGLDDQKDELTLRQLRSVELSLKSATQGLGFEAFKIAPGETFDPRRMECLGYETGEAGQVTAFVRPGYAIGNIIIRPAGVLIANPEAQDN